LAFTARFPLQPRKSALGLQAARSLHDPICNRAGCKRNPFQGWSVDIQPTRKRRVHLRVSGNTPDGPRTTLEPGSNGTGCRAHCVRFWFEITLGFGLRCASAQGMMSTLQHDAASAMEARQRSGAACFVAAPHCAADGSAAAWIAAVVLVMWNMRKRHFSHCWKTAAAEPSVKGAPFSGAFMCHRSCKTDPLPIMENCLSISG
jgi:hypothetical protein